MCSNVLPLHVCVYTVVFLHIAFVCCVHVSVILIFMFLCAVSVHILCAPLWVVNIFVCLSVYVPAWLCERDFSLIMIKKAKMEEEREHFNAVNYPPLLACHTCAGIAEILFE